MTNTQQLEEAPGQEYTELKPVEHSRIDDCTDGLKVIRSISTSHQGDEFFGLSYLSKKKHLNEFGINGDEKEDHCIEEEDPYGGVNGDFEYLQDREVYEFRSKFIPDEEELEDDDDMDEDYREEEDEDDEDYEDVRKVKKRKTTGRPRGRPRKTENAGKPTKKKTSDQSEKELQDKINEIIKKNYLLERENNNIPESNSELHREASTSSNDDEEHEDSANNNNDEDAGISKKYKCMLCDARFKGSGGLRNHYKVVHATGPLFRCDECGKEFPLKERLKLHVRTHTGYKPYKCTECDKSFARGGQLVQHRRTHSQVKPYSCELCPGTFTCAANLALHLKRHNGQKDHKCDICGRGFVRRDALKKHLECLHKDVKSFLCKICNKTFKGHLPQHMRTHARDRPHGCATCGQRFAQKSQLTVHQRTHSGQRPFRCLVCWQAFAHSTALKLHTRRHTGERPFKCAECNAGFTQLPHWKKHMKCIHGRSEPYCCRRCNSFFRIKSDLETHEKDCSPSDEADDYDENAPHKYTSMPIERMRLLLAVLLKRISKQERLDELGFGKRLIDDVLVDSLESAGKEAVRVTDSEFDALRTNLTVFLEWTVPQEHWDNFRKLNKTPEEILETLTVT